MIEFLKSRINMIQENLQYPAGVLEKFQLYGYLHAYQEVLKIAVLNSSDYKDLIIQSLNACSIQLDKNSGSMCYYYKAKHTVLEGILASCYEEAS